MAYHVSVDIFTCGISGCVFGTVKCMGESRKMCMDDVSCSQVLNQKCHNGHFEGLG